MLYRDLGKTGLKVSALGFGGWGIGGWKGAEDSESIRSIEMAIDAGVNFFDSALGYGNGHSEELIGKVIGSKADRDKFVVTSKVPPNNWTFPQEPGTPIKDSYSKEWIIECTEKSLKSYGLDYIDIQQFHVWINDWQGNAEWIDTFDQLKKEGKVRFVGPSINFPYSEADNGIGSMKKGEFDTVQVVHNIFQQEAEKDVFAAAEEKGVGIITRCPLDEGALSGKINTSTVFPEESFLEGYFKEDRKQVVEDKIAEMNWLLEEGYVENMAEAALRYCISFPVVSSIIVGMRSPKHTEANCKAIEKGPLPAEAVERLKAHAFDHNWWI